MAFGVAGVAQRLEQGAHRRPVEGVGGDGPKQVRNGLGAAAGASQGEAEGRPRGGQVGPGQGRLAVVGQVAGQPGQQGVRPPAQQVVLGTGLRRGPARVLPGGPLPLDPEHVEARRVRLAVQHGRRQRPQTVQRRQRLPGDVRRRGAVDRLDQRRDPIQGGHQVRRVAGDRPTEVVDEVRRLDPDKRPRHAQGVVQRRRVRLRRQRPRQVAGQFGVAAVGAGNGLPGPAEQRLLFVGRRAAGRPPHQLLPLRFDRTHRPVPQRRETPVAHAPPRGLGDGEALALVVQVVFQQRLQVVVPVEDALVLGPEVVRDFAVAGLLEEERPGRGRLHRPQVALAADAAVERHARRASKAR